MFDLIERNRNGNGNLFDFFWNFPIQREIFNELKTNIKNEEDKYVVSIELPGVGAENIDVTIDSGCVVVDAKRDEERYQKRIRLSNDVSQDVDATYKDGILYLDIKKNKSKAKKIKIK